MPEFFLLNRRLFLTQSLQDITDINRVAVRRERSRIDLAHFRVEPDNGLLIGILLVCRNNGQTFGDTEGFQVKHRSQQRRTVIRIPVDPDGIQVSVILVILAT